MRFAPFVAFMLGFVLVVPVSADAQEKRIALRYRCPPPAPLTISGQSVQSRNLALTPPPRLNLFELCRLAFLGHRSHYNGNG